MNDNQPQRRPKLIDLRVAVDLILARYYVVLLVGQDQRSKPRKANGINRFIDICTALILLIGLNILITSILVLIFYLLKSALGFNLLPGHMGQC